MKGRVIKKVGGVFTVSDGESVYICTSPGRIKRVSHILVGDEVEFYSEKQQSVITRMYARKNFLIRPEVSNVDNMLIVLSEVPPADLMLVDKLLIVCRNKGIKPHICINKIDASGKNFCQKIKDEYADYELLEVSAKDGTNIGGISNILTGKITVLSGQSAVGKSSILNALVPDIDAETGDVSRKIQRGKNTTRHTEMFAAGGGYIIDTPGFSLLEAEEIKPQSIGDYYPEIASVAGDCRFLDCLHISEPGCAVINAVNDGKITQGRYQRYTEILKEIKDKFANKY